MTLNVNSGIDTAWVAVALVWLVGLAFTKRTRRSQSIGSRLGQVGFAALGFGLLDPHWIRDGFLAARFAPEDGSIALLGLGMTVIGCGFAIWARVTLGRNWSGRATVKTEHELMMTGPYAVARHPIYTGLLVAVIGTALAEGAWRGMVAIVMIFLLFLLKMSQEERLMVETFPADYPAYQQRVKALIPGVF
jgi:protein-S-isoprenylcysteine O-methyltransferase Ste14